MAERNAASYLKGQGHINLIMDNLSCHKVKGVRELIEKAGAQLRYLPPYSSDFNPIEKMWPKIKAILRKLKYRSEKRLFKGIRKVFLQVLIGCFRMV